MLIWYFPTFLVPRIPPFITSYILINWKIDQRNIERSYNLFVFFLFKVQAKKYDEKA